MLCYRWKESPRVKEYDLYVPLTYNDGTPVEPRKLVRLRDRLLQEFGGLTFFPQSNEGFWTVAGVTYRDRIVIYRIISGNVRAARRFLRALKEELKEELDQEQILIVEKEAELL
jgi:hypothetical protein